MMRSVRRSPMAGPSPPHRAGMPRTREPEGLTHFRQLLVDSDPGTSRPARCRRRARCLAAITRPVQRETARGAAGAKRWHRSAPGALVGITPPVPSRRSSSLSKPGMKTARSTSRSASLRPTWRAVAPRDPRIAELDETTCARSVVLRIERSPTPAGVGGEDGRQPTVPL